MREALSEHASPDTTGNVCLFIKVNQLINIRHYTSLVNHSGHFCKGSVSFITRLESYIHCRHKRWPTVDLTVFMQLVGPIVVTIPGLTLKVGSNNPEKVEVAIPGTSVMVKIIINRFVPLLVRGFGV